MEMTFEQATAGFFRDGMEKGKQQGIAIGEQYGLEIGFRDGERKKQKQIVQNMLKEGAEMSFIEKVTGLTEKQILNYEKEFSKN